MTSERTVEKVTKMAPVGVRSNGVLQFRGHLNRERWGILRDTVLSDGGEDHALPSYCRLDFFFFGRLHPYRFTGFPRQNRRREKKVGPVPFPGLGRVDTPGGTVVVSSARAGTLPVDSRCSGPLQERVENAWSPRGRAFVPGKNPTGPEPTLGELPGPSCGDGDCGGAY